jgi:predicted DCC family thiol-disulfide oxidoreductase YuxK
MADPVLLYDADCGFCRWSVERVAAWAGRRAIRLVPLQDDEADRLLAGFTEEDKMRSWHLVASDGRVYSGGAVAPPLLRLLPGGRPLAAATSAFPTLTERTYRRVSGNRRLFGRMLRSARRLVSRRRG